MIVDALSLEPGTRIDVPVCIVGGGVAGIVLALSLGEMGIDCCLVEGGGRRLTKRSQSLYHGESADGRYSLTSTRSRFLGGSSNCWGGWTRPLTPPDFAERPWLRGLSWPIGPEALQPYYAGASELLQVPSPETTDSVNADLARENAEFKLFDKHDLTSIMFAMSPPTRFGRTYRERLAEFQHATVYLNATAVEVLTDETGERVAGMRLRSDRGEFQVDAGIVVLAAGGIENPRLLLASRKVHKRGIGNARDLVGRYFMDHPRVRTARVRLDDPSKLSRLYDVRHYSGGSLTLRRARFGAALAPSAQAQEKAQVLQSYTGLVACFAGQDHAAIHYPAQIYKALTGQIYEPIDANTVIQTLRILPSAGMYLAARKLGLRGRHIEFELETVLEPWPERDNRVELTADRDRFGLQKALVTWRRGELEMRTHRHAVEAVKAAVEGEGYGTVSYDDGVWEDGWEDRVMTTWHHIGTTRMASHPGAGVVDTNSCVFGCRNLFVAGSSVFPTGGGSPPTFTIVALALRLADHIRQTVRQRNTPSIDTEPVLKSAAGSSS